MFGGVRSIVETDNAGKVFSLREPIFSRNSQPACDSIGYRGGFNALCSFICRHTISDVLSIDLPENFNMVRVELSGHTDEGLLPFLVFLVFALIDWGFQYCYLWFNGILLYKNKDKEKSKWYTYDIKLPLDLQRNQSTFMYLGILYNSQT